MMAKSKNQFYKIYTDLISFIGIFLSCNSNQIEANIS
jgi:hypothetical protein